MMLLVCCLCQLVIYTEQGPRPLGGDEHLVTVFTDVEQ